MTAKRLVVFGLSISSSWGNGHASTYRGLLSALAERGWSIIFFEKDVEWYAARRDMPDPGYVDLRLYDTWPSVRTQAAAAVSAADAVLVGSYAGDAVEVTDWLAPQRGRRPLFFYDIDTPITLAALHHSRAASYLRDDQVACFDTYLSFTGGPALHELEARWGSPHAEALYCGVDARVYRPVHPDPRFTCTIGYMGTYAEDRQPKVEELLIAPARVRANDRFLLAGSLYPGSMVLPSNVDRLEHVYPRDHSAFYSSCRVTLNLTRAAMVRYGWAPSVRLFEAAACGACIVSDSWPGLRELLLPGEEILLAEDQTDVLHHLGELTTERRAAIGAAARRRVMAEHTYPRRAAQFEAAYERVMQHTSPVRAAVPA